MKRLGVVLSFLLVACSSPSQGLNEDGGTNENYNTTGICGDGVLDPSEQCDDGVENSDTRPGACRTDCRTSHCGDGVIDEGEQCEESDLAGSSCQARGFSKGLLACDPETCQFDESGCTTCGDDVAELGDPDAAGYETCDGTDLRGQNCISVGQAQGELACDPVTCEWDVSGCVGTEAVCGDGVVEGSEGCDDGNGDNTDACPDGVGGTCQPAQCGDGFVQAGVEGCDDGNNANDDDCPDGANGTCEWAECGDGHIHAVDEVCDTLSDPSCNPGCQNRCGDGVVDWLSYDPTYEACDDGMDNGTYGHCNTDCTGLDEHCGDGVVNGPEDCDGGTMCTSDCTAIVCGDGVCNCGPETTSSCASDCVGATGSNLVGCPALPFGPSQCCSSGCLVWDTGTQTGGVQNCGSCGNNCGYNEFCTNGTCTGWF